MTDLVTFLRARLDEDEQRARVAAEDSGNSWVDTGDAVYVKDSNDPVAVGPWASYLPDGVRALIAQCDPARILADVAAKRAIIDLHVDHGECTRCEWFSDELYPCDTLKLLASVYASHLDYQQEWKP